MRISDWSSDVCSSDLMGPGQMIAVDLAEGVIYDDHEIKDQIAGERPYSELIKDFMTVGDLADQPSALAAWDKAELTRRQVAANMTLERSEEHTSELQSLMRISYAVFCLKKRNQPQREWYRSK